MSAAPATPAVAGPPGGDAALLPDALRPQWAAPVPAQVTALMSTRAGGVSGAPFDSLNLRPPQLRGDALDAPAAVAENQRRFACALGATPVYLDQVHGCEVVELGPADRATTGAALRRADAAVTRSAGVACTVLVADCLPVLLCSADGAAVGAAHAGWRGLAGGVVERTLQAVCALAGCAPADVRVWLGACIGPRRFEVGADVLAAFGVDPAAGDHRCFRPHRRADGQMRWLADLPALARARLGACGVRHVSGGQWCTVEQPSRFFSFRRDAVTGRMAAAIARRA